MYQYDILVNREHRLGPQEEPADMVSLKIDFAPGTEGFKKYLRYEAACFAQQLFKHALLEGIYLVGISAYRSFERQEQIYKESLQANGMEHTMRYIAAPGASEHQTGLALDVSAKSVNYSLEEEFAECAEGKWLHRNAPFFGYILRYPKEKEKVTGYAYEPWHIRYVTKPLAFYLTKFEKTLEEYHEIKKRMSGK